MTFGQWLSTMIEEHGLSQSKLARRVHVSQSAISLLISDQRKPSTELLHAFADIFKVSRDVVFRAAGMLDPIPPDDQRVENWREILRLLTPEEEAELREIGLLKIKRREAAARLFQERRKQPSGHND